MVVSPVGATVSYYNWFENPSFAVYTNYIEDGGFESGLYDSGETYGNWSSSDSTGEFYNALAVNINSGVYSMHLYYAGHTTVQYNFYDDYNETLGADIEELSFYGFYADTFRVTITYSDATTDVNSSITFTDWAKEDVTDLINDAKYVISVEFTNTEGSGSCFIDDVVMLVDDGEGQDYIGLGTTPWGVDSYHTSYEILNETVGRLDNTSVYYGQSYHLRQILPFLDSDWIQFVDGYFYGLDSTEAVSCIIMYSDGTSDTRTKYGISDGSTWDYINFGSSWIDSDKYVRTVYFQPYTSGDIFYLDDVGIWSIYAQNIDRFEFTISPMAISITDVHFEVYKDTDYIMSCFLTNLTSGTKNENGTWIFSDSFGIQNGTMTNGFFQIELDRRTGTQRRTENVTVYIETSVETLYFEITSYWNPIETGETPIDDSDEFGENAVTNWLVLGVVLLVPSFMFAGMGASISPSMGIITFFSGLTLMGAISLSISLINIWFMLVIIIVDVIVILGLLRSNN